MRLLNPNVAILVRKKKWIIMNFEISFNQSRLNALEAKFAEASGPEICSGPTLVLNPVFY